MAILNHQLGLDKPLWKQYFIWIGHVFQGNLGQSFTTHQTTTSIIAQAFPIDLELIMISQIMALVVAVPLAMTSARRPNRPSTRSPTARLRHAGASPVRHRAVLVLLFAVHWHVFPGPAPTFRSTQNFWSNIHTMLLPSIVLALGASSSTSGCCGTT